MGVRRIRSRDRFQSRRSHCATAYAEPAVITLDLGLPPDPDGVTEGFKALAQILELAPDTKVIVLTGQNDVANALQGGVAGRP